MSDTQDEMSVARVRDVFDDWARRGRAEGMERGHAPVARRALEHLALGPTSRYLDIGCGNGYTVRWAAAVAPEGRAVGLDVSEEMVERARRMSADLPNAEFHLAAFPDHPLKPESFDAIFSMEVFYYLPDLDAALAEVTRLLVPGGRFACVVDFYEENVESRGWPEDVGVPMRRLDMAGWRAAFERAGMTVPLQRQITLPPEEASEEWKTTVGSLLTLGRRP